MADVLWRVGEFARRFPQAAAEIGRAHALHARAARALYETVGTAREGDFSYASSAGPCCRMCPPERAGMMCGECPQKTECCRNEQGTCCTMGVCTNCRPHEGDVESVYPEIDAKCDVAHALEAAQRDILADDGVDDVASAMEQAHKLATTGEIAALYAPRSPAKKGPGGEPGPEVCPICGAKRCAACGCCCQCCDSAAAVKDADGHEEHEE